MSESKKKQVAVLGAGSWGTALAVHLVRAGYDVSLWGKDETVLAQISNGQNITYLAGCAFQEIPKCSSDLAKTLQNVSMVVLAVPSTAIREICTNQEMQTLPPKTLIVSAAKGLEEHSHKRVSEVIQETLPQTLVGVLSGPSFAREVLEKKPTAATIAAANSETAELAAEFFHHCYFRAYTSTDLIGVEYGGALKNVLALAIGIADGMQTGLNTRAALITRGLAELGRFVEKLGGKQRTVVGLSGLGDLLLTATGDLSRNRQVGLRLGQGEKLEDILKQLGQVAEGVRTAFVAKEIADKYGIDAPIVQETYNVVSGKSSPKDSLKALLERDQKQEE